MSPWCDGAGDDQDSNAARAGRNRPQATQEFGEPVKRDGSDDPETSRGATGRGEPERTQTGRGNVASDAKERALPIGPATGPGSGSELNWGARYCNRGAGC